jgi:two-component system, cell cycle response regulator DivK
VAMSKPEDENAAEGSKTLEHQRNADRNRIMVVEDDHRNMRLMHDLLNVHGYEILQASDGLEAISLARDGGPDLILMDIRLPRLSGLDATLRLKQDDQTKAIPIIAVTAFATPGNETMALESGCSAYITKPLNVANLLNTIRSLLSPSPPAIGGPQ